MPLGLVGFDKRALNGASCLVGIDEVGRGCLAGPVVAAAVRCEPIFYTTSWCRRNSRGVDDSKRLNAERRAAIVSRFGKARSENWIQIGIGTASVEEIERHNIYHATTLAMRRALASVIDLDDGTLWESKGDSSPSPGVTVLIDGRPIKAFPVPHNALVKGDQRSLAVALASIHAKECRDEQMRELDKAFPQYGFVTHKGYGTQLHMEAIRQHGPTCHHRPSFLRKLRKTMESGVLVRQDSLF
jgi:ribonuclease HII